MYQIRENRREKTNFESIKLKNETEKKKRNDGSEIYFFF